MLSVGVLTAETAKRAAEYILNHIGDNTDSVMDVQILDPKLEGVVLWEFHRLEVSGFLDWAFLVGLKDVKVLVNVEGKSEGEYIYPVASLVNKVNAGRANGIARRQVERRKLRGSDAHVGRAYYADAAHNLLNEVCYGTTGWRIVRLESIVSDTRVFKHTAVNDLGCTTEVSSKRSAYIVNGSIVVRNTKLARRVYLESLNCLGTLVAISPNGILTMPATRERTVDNRGKVTTEVTGLEPTLSMMRITYVLVSNAFFVLELGPQSVKHQPLAAEYTDARNSAGYRETTVDEFEVIANSPEFSTQEKHICHALGIVVGDNVNGLAMFLGVGLPVAKGGFGGNAHRVLMAQWYEVFCGVANTKPHVKHFSRMVKNFRKHVRRFFAGYELPDTTPVAPATPIVLSGCNLRAMFHEIAEAPVKARIVCPIGSQWAQSHTIELDNGTELDGWIVGYYDKGLKCAVEHFQTELIMVGGDCI